MSQESTSSTSSRKVIIIGAGIYGLVAAKTYLEINPDIDLTILDADSSVGGVWSASRVYPGLVVDIPAPAFEFSDLRMTEEFGVSKWTDIPGTMLHEYLERYAEKFGILKRCRLNTKVVSVKKEGLFWSLRTKTTSQSALELKEVLFYCSVLLVATGISSTPTLPNIDTSSFPGVVIHSKDLQKRYTDLTAGNIETVVVVGSNKSAVEAASACAFAGKKVHWLIREDGNGPGMLMTPRQADGKYRPQASLSRISQLSNPTIFGYRGWLDRIFLSGKYSIGSKLFTWLWGSVTRKALGNIYEKSDNGKLLLPNLLNLFWSASGISFAHESELKFMDIVDNGDLVHVARGSIHSIKSNMIEVSDGSLITADAIIFATGWQSSSAPLFDTHMKIELGLPILLNDLPDQEAVYWKALDKEADEKVLNLYPYFLRRPKEVISRVITDTPFRLLRTIIPPKLASNHDRSIAFLCQPTNTQNTFFAEVSSLWTIAYLEDLLLDGNLIGNKDAMDQEVALMLSFMRWRYPGRKNVPFAAWEIRDWMDLMLRELGVRTDRNRLHWEKTHRNERDWLGWKAWKYEWFEAYEPEVYKGIVQEFLGKVREREEDLKKSR